METKTTINQEGKMIVTCAACGDDMEISERDRKALDPMEYMCENCIAKIEREDAAIERFNARFALA